MQYSGILSKKVRVEGDSLLQFTSSTLIRHSKDLSKGQNSLTVTLGITESVVINIRELF